MKWESFLRPLSPKNPLTIDNIGPFIALIDRVIIIIPLLFCYKYERKGRRKVDFGKMREREPPRVGNSSPLYK